ncbi:hypothetical protein [Roseovarius aestuariivivens]|uniref:hypothetical protein n=1 Tax=Roseovarius aestuariivivens TaxID=1888910 RepID=UPI0010819744|nr:hypothetical protein [Roseovarius aestuariivivens]
MIRLTAPVAALCLATLPALAQEPSGTITATVGTEERSWQVVAPEDTGGSRWSQDDVGISVTLVGREGPETLDAAPNLTLTFTASGQETQPDASNLAVTLLQMPASNTLSGTPENTDITLTAFSIEDDTLAVSGNFTAILAPGAPEGLVTANTEGAQTITGDFQATLQRADPADE